MGYSKLWADIADSSIWRESHTTRIVWVTLLAICNANGLVRASRLGLSDRCRVTPEELDRALLVLTSPDPDSRTPDNEGRRVEYEVGAGWRILNYSQFRERVSDDPIAEANRIRQRKHRAKGDALRHVTSHDPASASPSASASKGKALDKAQGGDKDDLYDERNAEYPD